MRDGDAFLFLGYGDLGAGDHGASKGGAEKVNIFVDGVALDGREADLFYEFSAEVLNVDFLGADLHGLLLGCFEVLCRKQLCQGGYRGI